MRGSNSIHLAYVLAVLVAAGTGCTRPHQPDLHEVPDATSEGAARQASLPLNAHASIQYVRDELCADCHTTIAESYRKHPMGNSLAPVHRADRVERFDTQAQNPLLTDRFRYEVLEQDGKMMHVQTVLDREGEPIRWEQPIAFVVGSGQRGRSYLIQRDSFLFMSPLTWYSRKALWDLSPGYEQNDLGFNRPILEDCLFCHADRAQPLEHAKNRYADPMFRQHAIGCQRCHGPGELHVRRHQQGETYAGEDATIVNPARLEPAHREAVCQQCHLSGVARVETRRQSRFDYRPGAALDTYLATYVLRADLKAATTQHFVGQVEQMYQSRCYQASHGKLGCISCHDPHVLPATGERREHYRLRCLQCHGPTDCQASSATRAAVQDDCQSCHMPAMPTDVRHASATDHRILRIADLKRRGGSDPSPRRTTGNLPIVAFPPKQTKPDEIEEHRNLAIALLQTSLYHPERVTHFHLRHVLSRLEQAVLRDPGDFPAAEALAEIQRRLGLHELAARRYQEVLRRQPDREHSAVMLASVLSDIGRSEEAIGSWEAATEINPWMARYWAELGFVYSRAGRWERCLRLSEAMVQRFPTDATLRRLYVESLLHAGSREAAEVQLAVLQKLHPTDAAAIRSWFDQHPAAEAEP